MDKRLENQPTRVESQNKSEKIEEKKMKKIDPESIKILTEDDGEY